MNNLLEKYILHPQNPNHNLNLAEYYNNIGDIPAFLVVDWEATWDQSLSYDFDFVDGYVFSSSF